jgi:hypothetical protein
VSVGVGVGVGVGDGVSVGVGVGVGVGDGVALGVDVGVGTSADGNVGLTLGVAGGRVGFGGSSVDLELGADVEVASIGLLVFVASVASVPSVADVERGGFRWANSGDGTGSSVALTAVGDAGVEGLANSCCPVGVSLGRRAGRGMGMACAARGGSRTSMLVSWLSFTSTVTFWAVTFTSPSRTLTCVSPSSSTLTVNSVPRTAATAAAVST